MPSTNETLTEKAASILEETARLCRIPSPTGMTREAEAYVQRRFEELGLSWHRTRKGVLVAELSSAAGAPLALVAHVDTLGGMVRAIKPSGRLRLAPIGGFAFNAVEGENCTVHTRSGKAYTGCMQSTQASRHVFPEAHKVERSDETVELVIDEAVHNADDVRALGIRPGDFVSFDPRTVVTPSGFIKSRHLDDKACVAVLLALAELIRDGAVKPARKTSLVVTTYEEVGHGGAHGIPCDTAEVLAVDMGAVGDDLQTDEFCVSICAKDSGGPYDREMTGRLVALAEEHKLRHAVDIYPRYSSDVDVALRAGMDVRHALVGPGVFASHGYERTHRDALVHTLALLAAYVEQPPLG